jgi:hypothetical protein
MLTLIPAIALTVVVLGPVVFAWIDFARERQRVPGRVLIALSLLSATSIFFAAAMFNDYLLGPVYSRIRFATIYCNAGLGVACLVLSLKTSPVRTNVIVACMLTTCLWLYLAFANSIV